MNQVQNTEFANLTTIEEGVHVSIAGYQYAIEKITAKAVRKYVYLSANPWDPPVKYPMLISVSAKFTVRLIGEPIGDLPVISFRDNIRFDVNHPDGGTYWLAGYVSRIEQLKPVREFPLRHLCRVDVGVMNGEMERVPVTEQFEY